MQFIYSLILMIGMGGCYKKMNDTLVVSNKSQTTTQKSLAVNTVPDGYTLSWEDEFENPSLNTSRWKYRVGISQQSYQRQQNVVIDTSGTGVARILLKKESYGGRNYTGGGIITKMPSSYGYYEIRAKLDGGAGWHEAFWTAGVSGFDDPNPLFNDSTGQLEIDCLEHYGSFDSHYFSYGAIAWKPYHGNVNRDFKTTTADLVNDFNVYGFEYTPDYLNYYFNGELLKTVDLREIPKHDFYLWLSCIATSATADSSGAVDFDYIRAYEITPAAYATRKIPILNHLDSLRAPQQSNGTDLWIQAEDFVQKNNWVPEWDTDGTLILKGFTSFNPARDSTQLIAKTNITVTTAGTYKLWVRSRDFATSPGTRKFKVKVNGITSNTLFGTHGVDGYAWQYGGSFNLNSGANQLELYDAYQYYARCDKMLLTTDSAFTPVGIGAVSNVTHY